MPLPLSEDVFALLLGEPLERQNLPKPGHGVAGELLGALSDFLDDLKAAESQEDPVAWRQAQAERADFSERFLADAAQPEDPKRLKMQ